jgi:hypothetical protein
MPEENAQTEEHRVSGDQLCEKIKELVHQGNVRRIIVKNERGQVLIQMPLTVGVIGAILVPVWVAIGAMAALVAQFDILVEKPEPEGPNAQSAGPEA